MCISAKKIIPHLFADPQSDIHLESLDLATSNGCLFFYPVSLCVFAYYSNPNNSIFSILSVYYDDLWLMGHHCMKLQTGVWFLHAVFANLSFLLLVFYLFYL